MAKRKAITKKTRFEVFKRDSFTCQYCGCKAPEVVLVIDHINPVAKGGDNDILNLITSCQPCNSGKSDRLLSDTSVVEKQRLQLEELNERRVQLEMLMNWRNGLQELKLSEVDKACEYVEKLSGYTLNDSGKKKLGKIVKSFGLSKTLSACEIAFDKYFNGDEDSFEVAFAKIGGVANMTDQPEHLKKIAYARGILKNRNLYVDPQCKSLMIAYYEAGYSMDHLIEFCKEVRNWTAFYNWITDL